MTTNRSNYESICTLRSRVLFAILIALFLMATPVGAFAQERQERGIGNGSPKQTGQFSLEGDFIDRSSLERARLEGGFTSNRDQQQSRSAGSMVSAAELSVPPRARKEFDKANLAMKKGDLVQARDRLTKALSIYQSAGVYNNLAVVFAGLGNRAGEREALKKALDFDDHFELAYVNWGRMQIADSNFPEADSALSKASALDPNDAIPVTLLAYSQFRQGNLQTAIASSQRAHQLGKSHALAHRIAAYSFVRLPQFDRAADELKRAMEEDPSGPQGAAARKEMEQLRSISR